MADGVDTWGRVLIQAGHVGSVPLSGAPGEAAWNQAFADSLAGRLRDRGLFVVVVGDWLNRTPPMATHQDWDLFYAIHYDAAIYAQNTGCFADRARYDPQRQWSDAFNRIWAQQYPTISGIPVHNERRNPNTWDYYAFRDTTNSTPGVLVEHGVGAMNAGWDAATLRDHLPQLAECVSDCIVRYLVVKLTPLRSVLWDGIWPVSQVYGVCPEDYPWIAGHDGLDIRMDEGTALYTPDEGHVVFSAPTDDGWGERVDFMDRWGRTWRYAHLTSRAVYEGDNLSKGHLIGYSGNTGHTTGPHLHLGLLPQQANTNNGYNGWDDPLPAVKQLETEVAPEDQAIVDNVHALGGNADSPFAWVNEIGALRGENLRLHGEVASRDGLLTEYAKQVQDLHNEVAGLMDKLAAVPDVDVESAVIKLTSGKEWRR